MVHIQSFGYIPSLLFQQGHFFSALLPDEYIFYGYQAATVVQCIFEPCLFEQPLEKQRLSI